MDSIHRAHRMERNGCHPSQSFLRFCAEECFFNVLSIRPSRARRWPQDPTRVSRSESRSFCNVTSALPFLSEQSGKIDGLHLRSSSVSGKNEGNAWWVLTAKSVVRIRWGTGLGTDRRAHLGERHCRTSNYWAARLVPGTASWKQTRIYGERVILARSPLMPNHFATPKVFLNLYSVSTRNETYRLLRKWFLQQIQLVMVIFCKKNLKKLKKYANLFILVRVINEKVNK